MKSGADRSVIVDGELDLRALGAALNRRRRWIIWPTLLVAVVSTIAVNLIAPRYKSEARLVYDGRENVFLRPEAEKTLIEERTPADQETLTNQVQIVLSRQLALDVIGDLKLNENPEFDPVLRGTSLARHILALAGVTRDLLAMSPEERVLESWYDRLSVYPVDKSRVIVIEFQSIDSVLAARIANAIAADYLRLQQAVRQEQTRAAGEWLSGEIDKLRRRVSDAEAKVEDFRSRTNLFVGTNNTMLSNQQLGEVNSQLAVARAQKADAESRAAIIRDMLKKGQSIEASDVVNSELIRRLSEQRVTLRAQLAEQSSTLLDGHPRIKELKAQISDLDRQIRAEAEKLIRSLENDARIATAKVDALSANLDALKRQAASTNEEDVQFRALEREAKAQRDLLESYLLRYRETLARESIGSAPPDAKIISSAIASSTPYFPKKLPIVAVATLITLLMCLGLVATSELLRAADSRRGSPRTIPADAPLDDAADIPAYRDSAERVAADVERAHAHLSQSATPDEAPPANVGQPEVAVGVPAADVQANVRDVAPAATTGAEPSVDFIVGPPPAAAVAVASSTAANALHRPAQIAAARLAADLTMISAQTVHAGEVNVGGEAAIPHVAIRPSVVTNDAAGRVFAGEPYPAASAPAMAVPLGAVKDVAQWLRQPVHAGPGVVVVSSSADAPTSLSALTIGRTLAAKSKVIVVGLLRQAPVLDAVSASPNMLGLSDVIAGGASFGQIISKDKLSRVHIVQYGRAEVRLAAILGSRQFAVMMEALRRAYDHIIIDAGTLSGECFRLTAVATRCVLIARDPAAPATQAAFEMLVGAGFTEVAILAGTTTQGRVAA